MSAAFGLKPHRGSGRDVDAPLALRAQARTPSPEPISDWSDSLSPWRSFGGLSGAANLNPPGPLTGGWADGSIDGNVWLQRNVGIPRQR